MERECLCSSPKKYRLTFDGGDSGNYIISLCKECYSKEDKQFLILEELVELEKETKYN